MANFRYEGLDDIRKALSQNETAKKALPDISIAILRFHNVLEDRVGAVFNAPGSIDSVRIGRSLAPEKFGSNLLRFSLQYRDKPVPLSKYPMAISASQSISSAPLRRSSGSVYWKKGKWSKEVKVAVRKGKYNFAKKGKNYSRKGFFTGTNIKARDQRATWRVRPAKGVEGIRDKYSTLFGPSIANLISTVYEKDNKVKQAKEVLLDEIIATMVKYT
jgi:hypothetical protein